MPCWQASQLRETTMSHEIEQSRLEMFRHYSNIRFLMLPMFFTSIGSVAYAYWKISSANAPNGSLQLLLVIAAFIVSGLFFVYECKLNSILFEISKKFPDQLDELRHSIRFGSITLVTRLLYLSPIILWFGQPYVYLPKQIFHKALAYVM